MSAALIGHEDVIVDAEGNVLQTFVVDRTFVIDGEVWCYALGTHPAPLRYVGEDPVTYTNEHFTGARGQCSHFDRSIWTRA
jgi:hypothetical protein